MTAIGSAGTLVATLAWVYWDPAFSDLIAALYGRYRWWFSSEGWQADPGLGLRLLLLALLTLFAAASTGLAFLSPWFGNRRDRSLRSLLLATALMAAWLSFFLSYSQLEWAAFQGRIQRALPRLQAEADMLIVDWPMHAGGPLPYSGNFTIGEEVADLPPNVVDYLECAPSESELRATRPRLGRTTYIAKKSDGSLRFHILYDLGKADVTLEYNPHGGGPSLDNDPRLNSLCIPLAEKWFLVRTTRRATK